MASKPEEDLEPRARDLVVIIIAIAVVGFAALVVLGGQTTRILSNTGGPI